MKDSAVATAITLGSALLIVVLLPITFFTTPL